MDRAELLSCMREAADALAEFRHLLPQHSPEAHGQMEEARQHVDYAIALLTRTSPSEDDGPPRLRLSW
jgi:hypothetical protein